MKLIPAAFQRTAADLTAEVLMVRAAFTGTIVLVEGPTDSRFIKRYLLARSAQVTICGGKTTLLAAMSQLSSVQVGDYFALADKDFDDRLGIAPPSRVYRTDTHDLETLLLSFALDAVLAEFSDVDKLDAFCSAKGKPILEILIDIGEVFSGIRYINEVAPRLSANMDNLSPWKYCDLDTLALDEGSFLSDYASRSGQTIAALQTMRAGLPKLRSWNDLRGHDMLAVLSLGLRRALGTGKQVSEENLSSALRLAFTEAFLKQTSLYLQIKGFEATIGYAILTC